MAQQLSRDEITGRVATALATCDVEAFRTLLSGYFKTVKPPAPTARRPPLGFRLPHGEYTFTVRPVCHRTCLGRAEDGRRLYECILDTESLEVEAIHDEGGKALKLLLKPGDYRWTWWSHRLGQDAVENFVELGNFFPISPETVFERSKDHCCNCGRGLTDHLSRDRGIGPECLSRVTMYFSLGPKQDRVADTRESETLEKYRSIDAA